MVPKYFSTWSFTNPKQGYILLELCFSLSLAALLAVLVLSKLQPFAHSWNLLASRIQLTEAQNYMLNTLEYQLGQNCTAVIISQTDTGPKLVCQTTNAQKQLTFTRENINGLDGLYVTTKNNNGSSKNPLYLPSCQLASWQAERVSDTGLLVTLELKHDQETATVSRYIQLLNGRVRDE